MASLSFVKTIFVLSLAVLTIGDKECSTDGDCDMEGAVCKSSQCICPSGLISDSLHTKCLPVSEGYGSSCEDNVQCSEGLKSGGYCNNGSCTCSPGYHYFQGQCWKSSGLGEPCKKTENCWVSSDFEAAVCSDGKCICAPGYYQREYSACRRESLHPGDSCGISLDCKFDNAVCLMNRTCATGNSALREPPLPQRSSDFKMLTNSLTVVGDKCKSNKDCPHNAQCSPAQVCKCIKGFYTTDNTSCNPELGAKCFLNNDCVGKNTMCRNSTYCTCKQGFVTSHDGRYCDKMSRDLYWSCLRNEQCGFLGPKAICDHKKCNCSDGTHYVKDQLFCWVQKRIGESCQEKEDCGSDSFAICQTGKCACSAGSHPNSKLTGCHTDSTTVGQSCDENVDCVFQQSFCNLKTKKCECLEGYLNSNGTCVAGVGAKCENPDDCKAEGSSCNQGKCVCGDNFIGSRDYSKCLPLVQDLKEPCLENPQCSKIEGVCIQGFCKCSNISHFVDDFHCFVSKKINEDCTFQGNCSYIPHSVCLNNFCRCRSGYHPSTNGTLCISGASAVLGQYPVAIFLITSGLISLSRNLFL